MTKTKKVAAELSTELARFVRANFEKVPEKNLNLDSRFLFISPAELVYLFGISENKLVTLHRSGAALRRFTGKTIRTRRRRGEPTKRGYWVIIKKDSTIF